MVFRRYLEQRRESGRVRLDPVPYPFCNLLACQFMYHDTPPEFWTSDSYVLVYEENGNVLALAHEAIKRRFDS
jgi:hypothetical protein